jgi:Fic family protein
MRPPTKPLSSGGPVTGSHPRDMTPLLPTLNQEWAEKSTRLVQEATKLDSLLPITTRRALAPLVRLVNSYYSNLIEGHRTLPGEVDAAMRRATRGTKKEQALVLEAMAHLKVQSIVDAESGDGEHIPTHPQEVGTLHALFFAELPDEMLWTEPRADGTRERIIAGKFRESSVVIGEHIPPDAASLPAFMAAFHAAYGEHCTPTPESIARIAAAHQRFAWIHPFLDGNGRVARLITDAMFTRAGLDAGGLWRISRGFARNNAEYKSRLAEADRERQGDVDGRGNLSQRGMDRWCNFVVDTALDQIAFMRGLLSVEHLPARITTWAAKAYPSPSATRIGLLIERVLRYGEVDRATTLNLLGVTDRHARRIISQLETEELVTITSAGALQPRIPLWVVPSWFPDLYPERERDGIEATRIKAAGTASAKVKAKPQAKAKPKARAKATKR